MALSVQGHSLGDVVLYFTDCSDTRWDFFCLLIFFQMTDYFFVLIWLFYVNIVLSDDVLKWVCLLFVSK